MNDRPNDDRPSKDERRHAGTEQFDVFLSHSSRDKPIVRELAEALIDRGVRPWLDEWELVPGRPWQEALEEIIQTTRTAAVLFGPSGLGPWEKPEMRAALSEFVDRSLPVIPVLLPGAPEKPTLPLFLKAFTWVDLRGGLTDEGLKRLIWGITGVKPAKQQLPTKPAKASEAAPLASDSVGPSLNEVLLAYSNDRLAEWEQAWTDPDDPDRLLYYVPPHYALLHPEPTERLARGKHAAKGRPMPGHADAPGDEAYPAAERVLGETEEETLANLLQTSDRLCVSEGPGAGKSIFTRRVLAFVCSSAGREALFGGKPALAVRWEEWDGSWPDDFHVSLVRVLEPHCGTNRKAHASVLAEEALVGGRVVLILDALDQVGTEDRVRHLSDFLAESKQRSWRLRVVVTGRPFAVEQRKATLLRDPDWRFACLEDFDAAQQYRYLYGPEIAAEANTPPDAWTARALPDERIERLVSKANLSAKAPEEHDQEIQQSLGELFRNYEQVADLVGNPAVLAMVRGLAEDGDLEPFERRGDLYHQTSHAMLRRAAKGGEAAHAIAINRIETVLAAIACEMMVADPNAYRLDGDRRVAQLRKRAARRVEGGISPDEWRRIEALTGLTNRSLLYGASDDVLAWHHKGMMEFYSGLHLATNEQHGWCVEENDGDGGTWSVCGDADVRRAAADPQWHWAFRFAIEMPADVRDPDCLRASLSSLFDIPAANPSHLRPTELMHRAWSLLEELPAREWPDARPPVLLPRGSDLIKRYRRQFQNLVDEPEHPQYATARDLLDVFKPCPPTDFIAACGNDRDPLTFLMGGTEEQDAYDDEKPQHPVQLTAFKLMSTPVTRQQYALFDANHELQNQTDLARYAPQSDCPAILVDWYDAWCFARWLGADYSLPTEAQWEYACRAGTVGMWCFGDDEDKLREYAWYGADWDKGSTHAVATKQPNDWRLHDMHGNVWEWCADWFDDAYYAASPTVEPPGPNTGSRRVYRGGCWLLSAWYCRSAYRGRDYPSYRFNSLGFRLALVPSSQAREKAKD